MGANTLKKDPYNIIITGVGGQGNVTASRIISNILMRAGYYVTIGETFGASQRGGSVMSHVRVSQKGVLSPQTPYNKADFVVSLEPIEAIKVLAYYGNPETQSLCNDRPVYSVRVIAGLDKYPPMEDVKETIAGLTARSVMIGATDAALKLGNPLFQNMIMVGAVAGMDLLPISKDTFKAVITESMPKNRIDANVGAYEIGEALVRG
jgi:indolepyruvate ferredoxin oxidoreductase beta subunit